MGDKSQIQWTDATWNPVTGCTKVSPGCAHCYIERTPAFRIHGRKFVKGATDVRLHPDRLDQPLRWKRPRRIFVNSLSDLFHESVSDEFIDCVFAVMALAPWHTFQVLTKRPERMHAYLTAKRSRGFLSEALANLYVTYPEIAGRWPLTLKRVEAMHVPLRNVWLIVSCENQRMADERIPLLLQTPAAVRGISAEPLLGPIDLYRGGFTLLEPIRSPTGKRWPGLDWVIVGGESGPGARPFDLAWARSLVGQCKEAGVACFVKQLGSRPVITRTRSHAYGDDNVEHRLVLRHSKGGDPDEWPEDLRVREYPRAGDVGGSDQAVAAGNTDCPGL